MGSHTVAALAAAGHTIRLLVRNADRVAPALQPLGVEPDTVEVAIADVTTRAAVAAAMRDIDAVVHAASLYCFDPRRAQEIAAVNNVGVRNMLETAVEEALDPIVHVSTTLALYRDGVVGDLLTAASPPGDSPLPTAGRRRPRRRSRRGCSRGALLGSVAEPPTE